MTGERVKRLGLALFALAWFWIWAFHVATGFFDPLVATGGGRRAGIVWLLDSATQSLLVGPLGRPTAVALLLVAGAAGAAAILRFKTRRVKR